MTHEDVIARIAEKVNVVNCAKCGTQLDVSEMEFFSIAECPNCHAQQPVPARLGNFLLLELLGKGGMAGVYRAIDEKLSRQVAIKVMRRTLGEDPKFVENFLREARAAAQLNHRNIVSVYAVGEEKGQPYIVMELLDGGRFDLMIAEKKEIDEIRVLEIALDVAEGLKAANDIGLVHGDIKPANILFDRTGTAKVADFGLARFESRKKLGKGEIWGTPYYIAPEKVRSQKEDHRSDIYSLGATLYHALGGKPPFEGKTATDVVLARLNEPPIRLSDIRPGIHSRTADVIARMLEPDPMMRYPNYASLISDLKNVLREIRLGPLPDAKASQKRKKLPLAVVIFAVVFLAISAYVIGLAVRYRRRKPPPPPVVQLPPQVVETTTPEQPPLPLRPEPKVSVDLLPVQPFDTAQEKEITSIAAELARPRKDLVDAQWIAFVRSLPPDHVGRPWGAVFYALAPWLADNREETERRLRNLADAEFEDQAGGVPHPAVLPRAAARFLLGRPFELPPPGEGRSWPRWFDDFMLFLRAYDHFRAGRPTEGLALTEQYAALSGSEPSWPYAFRVVAEQWKKKAEEWKQFATDMQRRLARGEAEAVLRQLEAWKSDPASGRFMDGLDERITIAREAVERLRIERERSRQEAERKAMEAKLQEELDRLDGMRAQVLPLLQRREFRAAIDTLDAQTALLTTPEARQILRDTIEACDRMDILRRFIIRSVSEAPFTGARQELRGDVVAARSEGIIIRLTGGVGEVDRGWDDVSAKVFADMGLFYVNRAALPPQEKAELTLALALYAYYSGVFRPAASLAETAVRLHPDLATTVRRLMPGILPVP